MIVLQCKNLEKNFGDKNIFSNITFSINEQKKIALVGKNGAGKTTLLNCIINPYLLDQGEITLSKDISIGYLEQTIQNEKTTLKNYLISNFNEILELRKAIDNIENDISHNSDKPEVALLLEKYSDLMIQYEAINGYQLESFIQGIVNGLGFGKNDLQRELASFSGGEKSKIALASLLLKKPKLLILDEPTNHLDISAIEWLESYLKNYEYSILLVSHDKRFIDNLVDEVYELENNAITIYKGNYSYYEEARMEKLKASLKNYEKQQKIIKKTEEFIQKYKAGNKAKQARGRQKQLDKVSRLEKISTSKNINLGYQNAIEISGNHVLSVNNLSMAYHDKLILSEINFDIFRREKIGLIGDNGSGKTTLLQLILEKFNATTGAITLGSKVSVGYFDQNHKNLNLNHTIYQEILIHFDFTKEEIRTHLARFLFFENDIDKPVSSLSGGEKARLSLMLVLLKNPNFLILDEPTNHLDLESQSIIEKYLINYEGTLLIVTHDRYLLDAVVGKLFLLNNKKLTIYYGNYSYYKEKLSESTVPSKEPFQKTEKIKKETTKSKSKIKAQIEEYELTISVLENEISDLKKSVNTLDAMEYHKFEELGKEIEDKELLLADFYEKWETSLKCLEDL